ncbi:TonB-dependent receptor [Lysobacter capsici]|jgi:outer membrane receptor protein involved in Fe transport|uniref:TonB-dependent receptor n=1 Tax=Lysobacter capsici TaxID=435897 RepID=UPI000BBABDA9|nr:TonB-dependent receptor [Lysobacter capsici]ATE71463.1 TonB-dependent receptor [Lysobacter capsici]
MIARQSSRKALSWAIALSLASLAASAQAQQAAAPAQEEEAKTLAGLTVTAQKREEAMQDVPISITALPQQLLQDSGVRDVKDVQVLVPGLTVSSTQSEVQTVARIRGIGTVGDNAGLESSVGVVVDGVYRPRNGVGFGDLGEIERIEVLKGPQGTVFGKNTSAGVINVITRRPTYDTTVEGEFTVGNYGALGAAGSLNTTIGENAAFRIYGAKRKRDGFTDVEIGRGPRAEREDGDQNFHTLRGQLLFEPTENLDINLIADFTSREENCCVGLTTVRGPTSAIINGLVGGIGVAPVADPFARRAWSNRPTTQDIKDKGLSAEVNWITPWFNGATLTSITASRDWQAINGLDFDFTTADIIYRNPNPNESFTGFKQFSQEFRLTGSTDKVDWMFGLFYADEDLKRNDSYSIGAAYEPYLSTAVLGQIASRFPAGTVNMANAATFLSQAAGRPFGSSFAGLGALDRYKQNSNSVALFTNNTWHATDKLDLTLGLRYTKENKELDSVYSNPNGGLGCGAALGNPARVGQALAARGVPVAALGALVPQVVGFMCLPWANRLHNGRVTNQERDEKEWSGTIKAAYRWNEHVMGYASAARGYKAGGFNLDRVQSSNGLSAGTAGITPVNDTSFPGEFVDSYELGAKTTWAGGNLLLNATLFHQTYSDFQLNSFLGTSFVVRSIPEVVSQGIDTEILWQPGIKGLMLQGGVMYADTKYGNDPLPDADLAKLPGARASFAPLWSASASVTYQWDFGSSLIGRANIGAKYSSDYNTGSDLDPEKGQEAYTVVNARVGIGAKSRRWMVEAWALNLFDEEYKQVGFDAPLQTGSWNAFLGAPRTYGVTLRVMY